MKYEKQFEELLLQTENPELISSWADLKEKLLNMIEPLTFTRKDLVRFGNYLLSKERRELYAKTEIEGFSLEERLSQVNHADVENFIDLITNGITINDFV